MSNRAVEIVIDGISSKIVKQYCQQLQQKGYWVYLRCFFSINELIRKFSNLYKIGNCTTVQQRLCQTYKEKAFLGDSVEEKYSAACTDPRLIKRRKYN